MPILELTLDASGAVTGAKQYDAAAGMVASSSDKAVAGTKKIEGGFDQLRAKVNAVGPIIITAVAAIGAGFATLAGKAIGLASDMEETQNKFNVVFKGMEQTAEGWATNLQQNYLMSREESKRFLSSIQDLLKPMGMAADEAGQMSFEVTKLAADLGSFNNLPTEQVMMDIQSALVGNFETMKKYGVVLNETVVQEKARSMGLIEGKEKLDAAGKAEAAYALMLEGSKDAIGDIARSSESYANQQKLLTANINDTLTLLGEAFLPMATQVITTLNNWLQQEENLNLVINATVETIRFLYNGFQGLVLVAKGVIVAVGYLADIFVKGFRAMLTPVDLLMKALQAVGMVKNNPLDALQKGVTDFKNSAIEGFEKSWKKVEEGNKYFDNLKTSMKQTTSEMGRVKTAADGVAGSIKNAANQTQALNNLTERVKDGVPIYDVVKNAAGVYEQVLVGVRSGVAKVVEETAKLGNTTKTTSEKIGGGTAEALKNTVALTQAAKAADMLAYSQSKLSSNVNNSTGSIRNNSVVLRDNAVALNTATIAAEEYQAVVQKSGGGGGDLSKTTTVKGSVNIPQVAGMSQDEWQGLSQQMKDLMYQTVSNRSVDSDYFNSRPSSSRFRGGTDLGTSLGFLADMAREQDRISEVHNQQISTINNYFNQTISRSDVVNIVEEMNRSAART